MGQCFLYGSGGGYPQYKVYNGLSAPSTPRFGDIWVKTSVVFTKVNVTAEQMTSFPSWGENGDVLICTGTQWKDDLYANSDHRPDHYLFLYPSRCMLYTNSAWANVDAYIYNYKSQWAQFSYTWNGELFDNGNQYTFKTGGWETKNGTQTSASPYLLISNGTSNAVVGTVNKIDVTNYSKLHFIAMGRGDYANGSAKIGQLGIVSSYGNALANFAAYAEIPNGYASASSMASLTTETTVDISGLSGAYSIGAYVNNPGSGVSLGIKKVWLT